MNGQGSRPGEGERNRKVNPGTWILHRLSVHRMTMRRLTTLEEERVYSLLTLFPMTLLGFPSPLHNKNYASHFLHKKTEWMGVISLVDPVPLKCFKENAKFSE